MNDPVLYAKSNFFQKVTTQKILREYSHLFQWSEGDSMLDIGCGTGDATIESILPLLPTKSNRLIGCEISSAMVDYAKKHNSHPNVTFQQLDIGGDVDEFLMKFGQFDHAASFFCLHWVQNQNVAMENISKLLMTNGDCLLVFITWSPNFLVYLEMSKSPKWSQYMKDVEQFISPYQESISPADDLRVMLKTVGFSDCVIEAQESRYLYDNYDDFVNFVSSINPFLKRIPASEQQFFVTDLARRTMLKNKENHGMEYLDAPKILVVYAKK